MAKLTLPRWLHSLVRTKPRTIQTPKRRPRLSMEELECRVTPATLVWDGSASSVWDNPQNWNNSSSNTLIPQDGDDLVFPGGAQRLANNNNIDGLLLNSITFSGSGYNLGGTGLTVGAGATGPGSGFIFANVGSVNNSISFDITLGGSAGSRQFFTVGTLGAFLTMSGELSGSTGVELSKDGAGTLILSADNSGFTGPISITEGAINVRNANALGDSFGATTVLTGGQLQIENVGIGNPINESLFLNGPGPQNDGALTHVSGTSLWAGPIQLDSNSTIGSSGGALIIQGVISDAGAGHTMTKEGFAQIVLDPINNPGTPAAFTGNTYRGQTIVNNGTLTIRHSLALGNDSAPVYNTNDTVVNSFPNRSGTLQLEFAANPNRIDPNVNAANDGFTVPNELLTLNGPGVEGIHVLPKQPIGGSPTSGDTVSGALNNLSGTNTWTRDISLWNDDSSVVGDSTIWAIGGQVQPTVGIGAELGSTLIIAGHIDDKNLTPTPTVAAPPLPPTVSPATANVRYSLIKTRPGRVAFVEDNYYRGMTEILEGYLNIRDSLGLGAATLGNVNNGTFIFPEGTLELEADALPDSVPAADQPHSLAHVNTDLVLTDENIRPMGNGANNDGAIRNIRGVNEITGNIQLQTQIPRNGVTFNNYGASFGVIPDYAPFTSTFDRSQLTLSGIIADDPRSGGTSSNLSKFGGGELVLTNDNTYTGRTFIAEGWLTARHDNALGSVNNNFIINNLFQGIQIPSFRDLPDNKSPETYINEGAMLVLKETRSLVPQGINLAERIFVSGNGIDHPAEPGLYPASSGLELNHNGAILSLAGHNTISGVVTLVATAATNMIGLGADIDSKDPTVTEASLSISNIIRDDIDFAVNNGTATQAPMYASIGNQTNTAGQYPFAIAPQPAPAGINKLGRKRVNLQGMGTFRGDNQVSNGVLRLQSDTALGNITGTTTVLDGGAIEFAGYETTEVKLPQALDQWAATVLAFSSQFSASSWSAAQATGAPNTQTYGDIPTAWSALPPNGPPDTEFLTLGFQTPVFAGGVMVRETFGNGFVTQIDLLDIGDVLHTIWTGTDPSLPGTPVNFQVSFPTTPYLVKGVKVYVNALHSSSWEEIDAVQLSGVTALAATTTEVNTFNGGLPGGIQIRETLILNGLGNMTADDPTHDFSDPTRVDTLTSVSDDNHLRGPITFQTNVSIDARADSRLSLWKSIDGPGGFEKDGAGKLVIGGNNIYQGDTLINQGFVNLQSSSALGSPSVSEVQSVAPTGPVGGTFTLTFNGQTTASLPLTASALQVQNALNALTSIAPTGSVTVTLNAGVYTVSFGGSLANTNLPEMTGAGSPAEVTVAVNTVQNGGGGTLVANGAQIEMQGDITIGGEALTIQGNGPDAAPVIPLRWYAEGGGPITNTFWSGNAISGRVTGVAVDPNDPNVIYLSAAGGGAWRSKNNGVTWQPLIDNINGFPVEQALFTGAIAVAPGDSNVIYVGLGESNSSGDSYYGRGLLKSSDFGKTWSLIQPPGEAFDKHTISKVVVDPVEPDTVYVAVFGYGNNEGIGGGLNPGNYGIWRLRGGVWVNLTAVTIPAPPILFDTAFNNYTDLVVFNANPRITAFNPQHPDRPDDRIIAFAIGDPFGSTDNAVYTSVDADLFNDTPTWTLNGMATTENPFPSRNGMIKITGVRSLANRDSIVLYAAITYPLDGARFNQGTAGTLRAGDGVQTMTVSYSTSTLQWSAGNWGSLNVQPPAGVQGFFVGQGWYDSVIAAQSQSVSIPWPITMPPSATAQLGNPNFVFIAGVGSVFTPGPLVYDGAVWNDVDPGTDGKGPHVDYHAYTFDRTGRLITGNDGGIWRMENLTPPGVGAAVWTNLNQSDPSVPSFLQTTQLNGVDVHPFNPFFAIGGMQDNGTAIYNDNPVWTDDGDGGDGGLVVINNKDPNIVFKTINGAVYRSTQGGIAGSYSQVFPTAPGNIGSLYFPLTIDRINPSRVLVGAFDSNGSPAIFESLFDGAEGTWFVVGAASSTPDGLSRFGQFNVNGGFRSSFGQQIALGERQGPWQADPDFPIVVDQGAESYDPGTIYVLTGQQQITLNPNIDRPGGVFVTKNGGQAWFRRNGTGGNSLPTTARYTDYSAIAVDPRNRDVAYVTRSVFNGAPGGLVFRTEDAAQNWTDITFNLPDVPVWSVTVNSRNGDVYVGTDNAVWMLPDEATTWIRLGVGLPNALVSQIVFNPLTNKLTISTYGRGVWDIWLDDSVADSGAIRAVSGSSVWTGPVTFTGAVDFRAEINAQINFVGSIGDNTAGANHLFNKVGPGRVVLSGSNTYGGLTDIQEGALVVRNSMALGSAVAPTGNTIVRAGAALELQSDLVLETVELNGNGINFAGHNTGALRSVSNDNTFTGTLFLSTNSTVGVDSGSQLTIGTKAGLVGVGVINDGAAIRQLTKELSGTLALNSANTYDGLTDVVQGILRAEHALALGATANGTQVRNGAQLQVANRSEIQNVAIGGAATGSFTLTFNGQTTAALAATATAAQVQAALNALSTIGGVGGAVSVVLAGSTYSVTFGGTLAGANQPTMSAAGAGGTSAAVTTLTNGGNITVVGEQLTLSGTGIFGTGALQNLSGNNTWQGNVTFTGIQGIAAPPPPVPSAIISIGVVNAADTLTIDGTINEVTVTILAQPPLIPNPVTLDTFGLTKVLPGKLVLKGANPNTYDGLTTVQNGVLNVQKAQALGTIGQGTVVNFGAALETQGNIAFVAEPLTLNGRGISPANLGALRNVAGANQWTGPVVLNSTVAAISEVQRVNVSGTSGTFTLTFDGETTASMPFNAPASQVESELNALTSIGGVGGSVTVTLAGNLYTVTFGGSFAGIDQPQMTGAGIGGANVSITTLVNGAGAANPLIHIGADLNSEVQSVTLGGAGSEVQTVTISGGAGTFTLTFNGQTTAALAFDAAAADVETALNSLSSIGGVGGSATVSLAGSVYTVTFGGSLANADQPEMTAAGSGAATATVATQSDGTSFTLTFGGQTTVALPFGAGAAQVQAALNALSTIGGVSGSVAVTRTGDVLTVTFGGSLANLNQAPMTGAGTGGMTVTIGTLLEGGLTQLTISGAVQDSAGVPTSFKPAELHKVGGGDLIFPNANTYRGRTFIDTGVLNIRNSAALGASGSAANDTTVVNGGTLQVQGGITVVSEVLTINGQGGGGQGALVNNGDANNWDGTVVLGSNASVGANTTTAGHKLTINGQLTDDDGTFNMTKVGPGTVEYASTTPNDYQGLTQVNEGILLLNKSGGALTFGGNLTIGNGLGLDSSAVVRLGQADQIPDDAVTTIVIDGLLDLNGFNEAIDDLVIDEGRAETDAGVLTVNSSLQMTGGELNLNAAGDRLFFSAGATFNATSSAVDTSPAETALIQGAGSLALLPAVSPFTIVVGNGPLTSDLRINSNISGTATERLIKDGAGLMEIDSTISFAGVTEAKTGILQVDGVIGAVELNGGTLGGTGTTGTVTSLPPLLAGDLDPSFGTGGKVFTTVGSDSNLQDIVLQPDGKIVAVGVANGAVQGDFGVVRYNPNGSLDATFGVGGIVITDLGGQDTPRAVTLQADGKIIVVGDSGAINETWVVVRYNADGTLDGTFGVGGVVTSDNVAGDEGPFDAAVQTDGKIVVVGEASTGGDFLIVRYNADGTLDTSFAGTGFVIADFGNTQAIPQKVIIQPDGKIIALGQSSTSGGNFAFAGVRYNGNGTLDTSFGTGGTFKITAGPGFTFEQLRDGALQADGKIVAGGVVVDSAETQNDFVLLRFNANGQLDNTFGSGGKVIADLVPNSNDSVNGVVIQPDGKIIATGDTGVFNSWIARFNTDGTLDNTFGASGGFTIFDMLAGDTEDTNSVVLQPDGKIVIGARAGSQFAIARFVGAPSGSGGGTVNPGDSPGTLHTGAVTWNAATTYFVELNRINTSPSSLTAGTDYDTLEVNGNININGATLAGVLDTLAGSAGIVLGDAFTIITTINGGQVSGRFAEPFGANVAFVGGQKFSVQYNQTSVVLTKVKANVTVEVTAAVSPTVWGQPISFTVTVTPEQGAGMVPASSTVTVTLTASEIQRVVVGTSGQFTLTFNGETTSSLNFNATAAEVAAALTALPNIGSAGGTVNVDHFGNEYVIRFGGTFEGFNQNQMTGGGAAFVSINTLTNGTTFGPVSNTLTNGQYSFSPSVLFGATLEVGPHTVLAQFQDPTNNFNDIDDPPFSAFDTLVHNVNKASSTIALSTSSGTGATSVYGEAVTITAQLGIVPPGGTLSGTTVFSGVVVFTRDGVPQPPANVFFNGSAYVAQITLPTTLAVGDHTISAVYSGDHHFNGVPTTSDLVQHIIKADSAVSVSGAPNPSNVNQLVTFTVQVSAVNPSTGIPTGDVVIKDGNTVFGTQTLDINGQATFQISTLTIGAHTINVDYQGDANFNISSGSTPHSVRGTTATTVVSSANPSIYGQSVNFTATVAAQAPASGTPTGNVQFVFSGATTFTVTVALSNGQAVLSSTSASNTLNAGANNLTVNYLGAAGFSPSSGTLPTQNVNAAGTNTALASSPAGSTVYGQNVTLTATVTKVGPGGGIPVGTVDFFDGVGNQIANDVPVNASGVAVFNTTTLGAGTHGNLFAVFTDNNDTVVNFNPSTSNSISRTVAKSNTSTALATTNANAMYGEAIITATVTPTSPGGGVPDGTVTFFITNTTTQAQTQVTNTLNASGVATLNPPLNVGSYQIFAVYNGSADYNPSANSNQISQTVAQAGTTTTLSTSDNNAVYGEAVISALVQAVAPGAGIPPGQVIFRVDNGSGVTNYAVNIAANGVATLNDVKVLDVGNYTITADYSGNLNFSGSNSASISQIVTPANSSVAVTSNINPSVYGQVVTFTATVTPVSPGFGVPPGAVDFIIDNVTVAANVPLTNGQATYQTGILTVSGSPHDVDVVYSGSNNFLPSNGTLSGGQTVNQGTTLSQVSSSANPQLVGQTVTFTATVSAISPAQGTPTGTVDFIIDGSSPVGASNVSLVNGQATFDYNTVVLGNHTVQVHYDGDPNFTISNSAVLNQEIKANTTTTVVSNQDPSVFGQQVTFTATVAGIGVAPGVFPTGTVTFIDLSNGNANLGTSSLNGAGVATLQISSLSVGEHSIRATYNGDDPRFFGSNGTLADAQTVNKANTTTSVTQDSVTTVFGQQVTFTATILVTSPGAGSPGGFVNFIIDGAAAPPITINRPVSGGQATLQISTLNVDSYTVHVDYLGDASFNTSTGNLSQNHVVNKADTQVTVTSSANPSVVTQNVTFTATIGVQSPGGGVPGGTVDFIIDGNTVGDDVPVSGGAATFSTSSLTIGAHTVQVQYNSNPNYNGSSGALAPNQQVNQNPIAFVIVPGAVKSGAPFSVVVHYRNAAGTGPDSSFNGVVTLAVNSGPGALGGVTSVNAVNGVATFNGLVLARAGSYSLRATANNLPAVLSSNIEVLASHLLAAVSPARVLIRRPFNIFALAVDVTGGAAVNYNGFFSLTIVKKPIGARISGPRFGFFSGGFGQLSGLRVSKAGIYLFRINGPNGLTQFVRIAIRGRRS